MDVGINVYWPGKRLFPESRSSLSFATPIHMSGTAVSYRRHPPLLGEHTGEVLNELVYNTSEVRIQGK